MTRFGILPRVSEGICACVPCGCVCEDAVDIVDAYAIPDPFAEFPGGTLTISRTDSECYWCGYSNGAVDERQKYELAITLDWVDENGDPVCGWSLSINDGSVILFKEWGADGSPLGTYEGETSTTVEEGEGTVNIPC